jgi:hypothetical protein
MSPADELRAAAKKIRDTAEAAHGEVWNGDERERYYVLRYLEKTDREQIAQWDPRTASLVADLLDHAANIIGTYTEDLFPAADPWMPLARAINGSKP